MSVYRIREWRQGSFIVEKRWKLFGLIPTWEHKAGPGGIAQLEEWIKNQLCEDAFRPKVISVWSEKETP